MAMINHISAGQTMATSRSSNRTETTTASRSNPAEMSKSANIDHDEVSLSQQGKAIGNLHQQLASQPSFDSAKVAAIKDAIANGSYSVDPSKLADSMMKFGNELV